MTLWQERKANQSWLVRYNEQLGKLNRVGLDIVTSLPDVAGWQALNS